MNNELSLVLVGVCGGILIAVLSGILLGVTYTGGYKDAYKDYHAKKIEQVVKKSWPALWIEYNSPLEVKDASK